MMVLLPFFPVAGSAAGEVEVAAGGVETGVGDTGVGDTGIESFSAMKI